MGLFVPLIDLTISSCTITVFLARIAVH